MMVIEMNRRELKRALGTAVAACQDAGGIMSRYFQRVKKVNEDLQYDIKLELDVRCQKAIEQRLMADFPDVAILGEEGVTGDTASECRWVVDPIDGTVNFAYQIPHCCVSIALQERLPKPRKSATAGLENYETILGVVYDPFLKELWTAIRGEPARLNGKAIKVSQRSKLTGSIVSIGFAKDKETLDVMLPKLNTLARTARKIRIMGSAALAMTYVASGRFDGYVEGGVRLWDIAAGGLIVECAGGEFWRREIDPAEHKYKLITNNGLLRKQLERL